MEKIILIAVIITLLAMPLQAEQRYNAMEGRWETVPDNSDWQTRYSPMRNDWSYQPKNAQTEYNPFENRWEWDSGHNPGHGDDD